MLLQSSQKVERSCPRVWSVSAAAVVLAGATFVSGLGLRAEANPLETPRKEEPKKAEEPRKEAPKEELTPENLAREIQKVLKEANAGQPGADPAEMQKRLQQLAQQLQQLQQQQIKFKAVFPGPGGAGGIGGPGGFGLPPGANVRFQVIGQAIGQGGRLGIAGSAPSKVLADQFDLPAGKGLVIDQVVADSAAAKAGLKVHDILLQLDGKDVPSNMGDLARIVDGIKANTAVEAVIFRKGKKETLKGITLAAKEQPMLKGGRFVIGAPVPPFPGLPGQPGAVWVNPMAMAGGLGNGIMTNIFRTDDRFTTRHQEGNLIITITGKVADGKTSLGEIVVQDGAVSNRYESIDKVPEQYRDKAKNLLEMSAKSSVKIEIKNSR